MSNNTNNNQSKANFVEDSSYYDYLNWNINSSNNRVNICLQFLNQSFIDLSNNNQDSYIENQNKSKISSYYYLRHVTIQSQQEIDLPDNFISSESQVPTSIITESSYSQLSYFDNIYFILSVFLYYWNMCINLVVLVANTPQYP